MELEHEVESYASSKSVGIIYDQNRKCVRVWITVLLECLSERPLARPARMLVGEAAGEAC